MRLSNAQAPLGGVYKGFSIPRTRGRRSPVADRENASSPEAPRSLDRAMGAPAEVEIIRWDASPPSTENQLRAYPRMKWILPLGLLGGLGLGVALWAFLPPLAMERTTEARQDDARAPVGPPAQIPYPDHGGQLRILVPSAPVGSAIRNTSPVEQSVASKSAGAELTSSLRVEPLRSKAKVRASPVFSRSPVKLQPDGRPNLTVDRARTPAKSISAEARALNPVSVDVAAVTLKEIFLETVAGEA